MFGGVRFGGTLTVESAFALGFDHIALCAGAGRPTIVPMKNGLARGVRQASDFLMALQLTGAAKTESIANLTVRLPVVVIGGGLTAIDTATESLAYYPVQVEKFLARYETLVAERGEAAVRAGWSEEEREAAEEFIAHARAIRAEREAAAREGRKPRLVELLDAWGGVTIAYRRRLIDAPSYTLNHEEVAKAMEEGIRFAEGLAPEAVEIDRWGHAEALTLARHRLDEASGKLLETEDRVTLPARTILVAAGTQPNTVLAREDPVHVALDGRYFQAYDEAGQPVRPERVAKPEAVRVLMSLLPDGRAISFFGDLHPSFTGNVVKAMGGAKQGYPVVSRMLAKLAPRAPAPDALLAHLNDELRATVQEVVRLTPNIVEVVVRAPQAARAFHPGQFYRLQNYETHAAQIDGTTLAMEGLALTGASVDREAGLLSTIVLEMGGSSDLCTLAQAGRAGGADGPDRNADRDARRRDRAAGRRRARQRGAVLDRPGACAPTARACSISPATSASVDRYKDEEIEMRGRRRRVVLRRGAGLHAGASAGPCLRRQHRRGDGRLRRRQARPAADRASRHRPAHRHRLGRHDGGGRTRAARACWRPISSPATAPSPRSTRRCNA